MNWTEVPVLAIETSSSQCCVALRVDGNLYCADRAANRSHKELLLPMIRSLCAEAAFELDGLGVIACGAGPGSFTGVRIGVAATQALGLVANCRIRMLNSLDVLAEAAQQAFAAQAVATKVLVCARRSRGEAYYVAAYNGLGEGSPLQRTPMALCTDLAAFEDWSGSVNSDFSPGYCLCGERPPWLPFQGALDLSFQGVLPSAALTMAVALRGLSVAATVPPEAALPIYLPEDSPWKPASPRPR